MRWYNLAMELLEIIKNKEFEKINDGFFNNELEKEFAMLGIEIIKTIVQYRLNCNVLHEKIEKKEGALTTFSQKLFLSKSTFFQDDIHEKYYLCLDDYALKIKEKADNIDNKELVATIVDALYKELCKPANKVEEQFIRINYDADDYIFHELIPYLSNEELSSLYAEYVNRRTSDFLPNQKKLLKELKEELLNRNLDVPKKKFKLFK